MADRDEFYFSNLNRAAGLCVDAAVYLRECFLNYDYEKIGEMLEKMHEIERKGDDCRHEMLSALARAFVTPVDREDIALISQKIDDVNDSIEEVLQRLYIDSVGEITNDAIVFCDKIVDCTEKMSEVVCELKHFKKSEKIHRLIVELNKTEEECDKIYLECSKNAKNNHEKVFDIFTWRAIYDMLEKCADECEHTGDCIDTIIMKNT